MADDTNEMAVKRLQVIQQCRAVAHMARAVAQLHLESVHVVKFTPNDMMLDLVGARTASFMEKLGDMLNATDAVTAEDEWINPIMEAAQLRWPTAAHPPAAPADTEKE